MKILGKTVFLTILCLLTGKFESNAQQILHYKVEEGDTLFVENLRPSFKWGVGKKEMRDWKKYTRLVYNFSKTYPYALAAKDLISYTDSLFIADNYGKKDKQEYVRKAQKMLFHNYEGAFRQMTITQGQLLMRLIDREVGRCSFEIIKGYKNGFTASFWQGIARLFGTNMKTPYDPKGEDKATEELVRRWNRGEFPEYYYSIFGQYPKIPVAESKRI